MKLLILGKKNTYECKRILVESNKIDIDATFKRLQELTYTFNQGLDIHIKDINILEYDVVLIRGVGKMLDIVSSLAEYLHRKGKIVIDEKLATTKYTADKTRSMFLCDRYNLPYPKTIQVFSEDSLKKIEENLEYPLIAKDVLGSQGLGVYLLRNKEDLHKIARKDEDTYSIIFQKKLRKHAEDFRVFVVGKKGLGIMKKVAQKGEYRSNVSQGGNTKMIKNDKILQLGVKAAMNTRTEIAGVDIMLDEKGNPYILEINRAPQFKGFETTSGINVAQKISNYILEKYRRK